MGRHQFMSKAVIIEAVQFKPHDDLPMETAPSWFVKELLSGRVTAHKDSPPYDKPYLTVQTANGPVRAEPDDWIIREPSGTGCYPCKPDVFAAKYEPLNEPAEPAR